MEKVNQLIEDQELTIADLLDAAIGKAKVQDKTELSTAVIGIANRFRLTTKSNSAQKVFAPPKGQGRMTNTWSYHQGDVSAKKNPAAVSEVSPEGPVTQNESLDVSVATDDELMEMYGSLKEAKRIARDDFQLEWTGNISKSALLQMIRDAASPEPVK